MGEGHPIIACYGGTELNRFPLLLAIGREPNSRQVLTNHVGLYDFRQAPRCAFWNTSYSVLAEIVGLNIRSLKRLCDERAASPLIYADALPHCLKDYVAEKDKYRSEITADEVIAHIDALFSHRELIERVRLAVMSGLTGPNFRVARVEIASRCQREGIRSISTPFFYGSNTEKIRQALTETDRSDISGIFQAFEMATRASGRCAS